MPPLGPLTLPHRSAHPTGQQALCVRCAGAGVARLGVSRDGPGSAPVCLPCWRGPLDRAAAAARRRAIADLRAVPEACAVCGSAWPAADCWLCGWQYLRVTVDSEDDQTQSDDQTQNKAAAAAAAAEDDAADLAAWVERLRATLDAHQRGGGRGRAIWLLADLLARDAAARTTTRGRPGVLASVAGVMAVDSDWRSGRRAMPGRARCAELVGCTERAVSSAWRRTVMLGWATRVRPGRRLTLAERVDTGRAQDRAVYDLVPLHRSDVAGRADYVDAARRVLADLLDRATRLLAAAEERVAELRARAGGWVERVEAVRRARLRAAAASIVEQTRTDTADIDSHILITPHMVCSGKSVYSRVYLGFVPSPITAVPAPPASGRLRRRKISTRKTRRPAWARWAYPLARAAQARWQWLAAVPLPRVAAVMGSTLGPDWTLDTLESWLWRARRRPLLAEPSAPLGYLRAVLREVLTGPLEPPAPARLHTEHRRRQSEERAAQAAARIAAARAAAAERARAAVPVGRRSPAVEAALAAVRARTSSRLRRPDRVALLDAAAS